MRRCLAVTAWGWVPCLILIGIGIATISIAYPKEFPKEVSDVSLGTFRWCTTNTPPQCSAFFYVNSKNQETTAFRLTVSYRSNGNGPVATSQQTTAKDTSGFGTTVFFFNFDLDWVTSVQVEELRTASSETFGNQ